MNRREVLTGALAAAAAPLLPKGLAASPTLGVDLASGQDVTAIAVYEIDPPIYTGPRLYLARDVLDRFLQAGYPAYMMTEVQPIPIRRKPDETE